MANCEECGRLSDNYKLCTRCKKEWKEIRLKAYENVLHSRYDKFTIEFRKELLKEEQRIKNCKHISIISVGDGYMQTYCPECDRYNVD